MKNTILKNWSFMRIFRLALGIFIIIQSIMQHNNTLLIMGSIFTLMPLFNVGCCGVNGCQVPNNKTNNSIENIQYEEVV